MVAVVSGLTSAGPDTTAVSTGGPTRQTKPAGVGSTLPTPSTARTRSSCDPGQQVGELRELAAAGERDAVERALEVELGLVPGEGEDRDRVRGHRRRVRVDPRVRRDVDRPLVQRRRLVGNADRQHGRDLERVLARRETGVVHRRRAQRGRRQVERALERRAAVRGEERERRGRRRARVGRSRDDVRLGLVHAFGQRDRPLERGRLCDVQEPVRRLHLEGVVAERHVGDRVRGGARRQLRRPSPGRRRRRASTCTRRRSDRTSTRTSRSCWSWSSCRSCSRARWP